MIRIAGSNRIDPYPLDVLPSIRMDPPPRLPGEVEKNKEDINDTPVVVGDNLHKYSKWIIYTLLGNKWGGIYP